LIPGAAIESPTVGFLSAALAVGTPSTPLLASLGPLVDFTSDVAPGEGINYNIFSAELGCSFCGVLLSFSVELDVVVFWYGKVGI